MPFAEELESRKILFSHKQWFDFLEQQWTSTTAFWTFCPSKPLQAFRIFLLPCMSSDLYMKCHPPWWVSDHCFPCFLSSPAPKAVLHHSPLAALQMRFCGILAVEAVGSSHALPGRSLYKDGLLVYGKRGNTWIPRERNVKKIESGLVLFISFLVWFLLIHTVLW